MLFFEQEPYSCFSIENLPPQSNLWACKIVWAIEGPLENKGNEEYG